MMVIAMILGILFVFWVRGKIGATIDPKTGMRDWNADVDQGRQARAEARRIDDERRERFYRG